VQIASLSLTQAGSLTWQILLRGELLLLLSMLWLLSQSVAHAAEAPDSVRAWRENDVVVVHAQADLDAPLRTAWNVLTDYEGYAQFIPDLKSSRVLARSGNTAIVEQKGEAGFFFYHLPLEVTFSVTEEPSTVVSSRAISGTFKEMTGRYVLSERGGGVRLTYDGRMIPAFHLPPLIGMPALRAALERRFLALAREIRRVAGATAKSSDAR
jgi:ribosome-associated toxin RatA of RatAB toxin-antitoxin module